MSTVESHDLGNGWEAVHRNKGKDSESLTLRNIGMRQVADLPKSSIEELRKFLTGKIKKEQ